MNLEAMLKQMMADPAKARCELSLLEFTKQAWEQLEPGVAFQHGWAVAAIAEHLQAVTEGHIKRLLINVPPGCTKSMLTNVMWPAWEWGPRGWGHMRYISASYEQGLAVRDMVRCRDLLKSEWYQQRWPIVFKDDQDQKTFYANERTGWRFASSVRASLVGYRGDRIIIDDPHSVKGAESDAEREESLRWFTETIPTRLNRLAESAIVVIMQRLHQRDISGLIIDELGKDWTHLCLPMSYEADRHCSTSVVMPNGRTFTDERIEPGQLLWPERFPGPAVESLKAQLRAWGGSYAEAAQLQQRPAPREGGMFKIANFRIVDAVPPGVLNWVRGWDLAATSKKKNPRAAFTAGVKMGMGQNNLIVVADIRRIQGGPFEVKDLIQRTAHQDGRTVRVDLPQDPGQAGVAQIADYVKDMQGYSVFGSPEAGDKDQRALPFASQVEAGNVVLVRGPWLDAFLGEAALFPMSTYKDQIDACSRAYAALLSMSLGQGKRVAPILFQP